MKIYISGPMTGIKDFNYPEFNRHAAYLRSQGHDVYNPTEFANIHNLDVTNYAEWKREAWADFCKFITVEADAIYMLAGHTESQGALCELALAEICGLTRLSMTVM